MVHFCHRPLTPKKLSVKVRLILGHGLPEAGRLPPDSGPQSAFSASVRFFGFGGLWRALAALGLTAAANTVHCPDSRHHSRHRACRASKLIKI